MLECARREAPANLRCVVSAMLEFARSQSTASAALIVSTWALGYSRPARLIRECGRVLPGGGAGAQFVLLGTNNVAAPLTNWTRLATNTTTPNTFTIPAVGSVAPFHCTLPPGSKFRRRPLEPPPQRRNSACG
jgi:hypothetical protein